MAEVQEQVAPGGHYSGTNRIPNIQQFVERLDKDKKERDAQIDRDLQAANKGSAEARDHALSVQAKGSKNRRTVRDPVTGRDVEIEDMDSSLMKAAKDPQVRRPRLYRQDIPTPRPVDGKANADPGSSYLFPMPT